MALSISAYNPQGGYKSEVKLPEYPWDTITKVLQYKQGVFDKNFQTLQGLKSSALNIQFLNKERQQEVDKLNKDLETKFSNLNGEYSDLTDSKMYQNYTAWFDNFSKNTDLIHAYHEDKKWQNELGKVQTIKQSKDPNKAGYSAINEFVFNTDLNGYVNSTKNNKVDFSGYTPYTDTVAETTRIFKSLPKKEWFEDKRDGSGNIVRIKHNGYDKDDMDNVLRSMGGNMLEQFRVEARYNQINGLRTNPVDYRSQLHANYVNIFKEKQTYIEGKKKNAQQRLAMAQTEEEKSSLNNFIQSADKSLTELGLSAKTKDWFLTTSENDLLGIQTQLHSERKISSMASGLATKPSIEIKPDLAYFSNLKIAQQAQQFNVNLKYKASQDAINNQLKVADLSLKGEDLKIKQGYLEVARQKENKSLAKDANGNTISTNEDNGSMFSGGNQETFTNQLPTATIQSYMSTEDNIRKKAFNIADDDKSYQVPVGGKMMDKDQVVQTIVSMYDVTNPGRSQTKIKTWLNQNGLAENISLNTMVDALPITMYEANDETAKLDLAGKVGLVKTRTNQILSGDSQVLTNPSYQNFVPNSTMFHQAVQEQESFNQNKANNFNRARKENNINKSWEQMTEGERNIISKASLNYVIQDDKLATYGWSTEDYSHLGDSPKKGEENDWNKRVAAAQALKIATNTKETINPILIHSAKMDRDGNTIIQLNGIDDFKKVYEDGKAPNISVEKGSFEPNGFVMFKTKSNIQDTPIDRIISNGNTYQDIIQKDGISHKVTLFKSGVNYYYTIDGSMPKLMTNANGATPSNVYNQLKSTIQQYK